MSIYPSTKVRPYVYICFNRETGEFYIGYRETNKLESHLDLPKYKTSSKLVKPIFAQFDYMILAEFEIGNDAYDFEQQLIFENWQNPLLLNGQYRLPDGKTRFKSKKGINMGNTFGARNKGKPNPGVSKALKGKPSPLAGRPSPIKGIPKGKPAWNKGKTYSVPSRRGVSTALKGQHQPKATCPHCGKEGGIGAMNRYHFNNCKNKS